MRKVYRQQAKRKVKVDSARVKNTKALPSRAASTANSLQIVSEVFGQFFSDENFATLLCAESVIEFPAYFVPILRKGNDEHEVG